MGMIDNWFMIGTIRMKKSNSDVVRIQHGYDRGGNRLYRRDMVASSHSELYQYDQMNQLVKLERGALNSSNTAIVSNTFEEDFTYDVTGNWLNYKQDANGDGTFEVNQTRTHNAANEILTISGGNTLVSHDRNGCMTKVPKPLDGTSGYTLVYDAWNRLISVSDGDTVVATYVYDARNHRIKKTVGNTVTLSYFNRNWQEVESTTAGVTTTYVYGLRYIDDIICRTTSNNGNIQTLYAVQDANWNVVALVTPSDSVAERMTYDSFGRVTFRDASFVANVSQTTSSYNWTKTFTGQVYDVETGLMLYRNRYYHPDLGRFITRDPIGYDGDSVNLYRYVKNQSSLQYDSHGNDPCSTSLLQTGWFGSCKWGYTKHSFSFIRSLDGGRTFQKTDRKLVSCVKCTGRCDVVKHTDKCDSNDDDCPTCNKKCTVQMRYRIVDEGILGISGRPFVYCACSDHNFVSNAL